MRGTTRDSVSGLCEPLKRLNPNSGYGALRRNGGCPEKPPGYAKIIEAIENFFLTIRTLSYILTITVGSRDDRLAQRRQELDNRRLAA